MNEIKDVREGWTSASNSESDALCPGRHLAQKGLTEPASTAAEFGDKVHAASEGQDVALNITQEKLLEKAQETRDRVLSKWAKDTFDVQNEVRLWVRRREWSHSGQCDKLYLNAKRTVAVIEDLKSLRGQVAQSPENKQLRDLAVLTWLNYPTVNEVVVFINQPMASMQVTISRYNTAVLQQAWAAMRVRIGNSNDPKSVRVAGKIQCHFCKANGVCPEAIKWHDNETKMFAIRGESANDIAARIPVEKLADFYAKTPTFIAIVNAVRGRLLNLPDDELKKVGLSRRPGFYRETINDSKALVARLKAMKVKPEAIAEAMTITKGNLEKLVRDKTQRKGKELDATLETITQGIVDRNKTSDRLEWIS